MKTALVALASDEVTRLRDRLRELGHEVEHIQAAASPDDVEKLGNDIPGALFVDATANLKRAVEFTRTLRRQATVHYPVVIALCGAVTDDERALMYEGGVDHELQKPVNDDALKMRLRLAERIARWRPGEPVFRAGSVADDDGAVSQGPVDISELSKEMSFIDAVSRSATWRNLDAVLQAAAGGFLMMDTESRDKPPKREPTKGCVIDLANADHGVEVRIALGVDAATLESLTVHLFGESGDEFADDTLTELGNMMMGGFKTGFSKEKAGFASGLPKLVDIGEVMRPTVVLKRHETRTLSADGVEIFVSVGLRSKENRFVVPGHLAEGMVVVNDVFNPRGILMVKNGTRLSSKVIGRLRDQLAPKQQVEVMAP